MFKVKRPGCAIFLGAAIVFAAIGSIDFRPAEEKAAERANENRNQIIIACERAIRDEIDFIWRDGFSTDRRLTQAQRAADNTWNISGRFEIGSIRDIFNAATWRSVGSGSFQCTVSPDGSRVMSAMHDLKDFAVRSDRIEEQSSLLTPNNPKATQQIVQKTQNRLNVLGYNAGSEDGVMGPKTRRAIEAFQHDQGVTVTGDLSEELLERLKREKIRTPESQEATTDVVAADFAAFVSFDQESDRITKAITCRRPKVTPPGYGLGYLYGCISGGAETVKIFVNEVPSTGKVENVKIMWNDWFRDGGWGVHADQTDARRIAEAVLNLYDPAQSERLLQAFFANSDAAVTGSAHSFKYTYRRGPKIDERLIVITPK